MGKLGKIRIGLSGWTYKPWRGVFYPKGLVQKDELSYAARQFPAIEINGTFYSLQRPESFARWAAATPEDFVFAVKAPRFITHIRRLRDIEAPLANFLASGVLRLGPKLGPLLWQFPPQMKYDPALFQAFFDQLPHNTKDALALARHHDSRLDGRSWLKIDAERPLRHAVEIRHESFCTADFIKQLRRHKIALVCADTVEWPLLMDLTSDFIYCRLHGSEELYVSGYDSKAIGRWAKRVAAWAAGDEPTDAKRVMPESKPRKTGRDVFVFFDNDAKVRAPADAAALIKRLKLPS